jgi:hypothetical protein
MKVCVEVAANAFEMSPTLSRKPCSGQAPPDPLAHHEALRELRTLQLRSQPRLQESRDQEVIFNFEAHSKDLTIVLGRNGGCEFHTGNEESGWRVTFPENGFNAMTAAQIASIRKYVGDDDLLLLSEWAPNEMPE